ncbi:MAG: hypothetical protein JWN93_2545 [Hyphomicrobiales bacterium]|nr:hypothetical protein [Hyphomicrobiales bacterium]
MILPLPGLATFRARSAVRRSLAAAVGASLLAGLAATPALALDDGDENMFSSISGILGLTGLGLGSSEDEKPRINYRERAPLVLPPNLSALPAPAPPVEQRGQWVQDYDKTQAQKAQERARRPRNGDDTNIGRMSNEELAKGRLARPTSRDPAAETCNNDDPTGRLCDPTKFWDTLKNTKSAADTSKDLVPGQEPARRNLTDPPKGLRAPTQAVKYTFDAKREVDMADPRAQMREDARRSAARNDGRDPDAP